MDGMEFINEAIRCLVNYYAEHDLKPEEVTVVWACKTLGNNKALLCTRRENDDTYYEVTYNGAKGEIYLDCYKKIQNIVYPMKG